jgi:hypothetical protein
LLETIDSTPQAGTFDQLLEQCREVACERLCAALSGMLGKADEALTGYIGETQSSDAQRLYQDARKLVREQRQTIERQFLRFYLNEFRFRIAQARDETQSFAELQQSSLKLVGEDDLDETLRFKALAGKLRKYCDEELAALDQRVGVLLGDAGLAAEDNPFSPEAICDAYQQACRELDASMQLRGVLLKLFDDHVIDELRSIYKALNGLLVRHAILPKIRYGVSKTADESRAAGKAQTAQAQAAAAAQAVAAAESNVFALLQSLVASGAGAALGLGAAPPQPGQVLLAPAELLGSLTRIQRGEAPDLLAERPPAAAGSETANVLRELKSSTLGAGMAQMDAMTLDIVAMLFDQLFDDPKIPVGLKGLIGRLQIPMLKVAIADKALFSKKTHPARQVLDTFGELALRLPVEFSASSPLFPRLDAVVQQLLDGFQEDIAVFDAAQAELRAIIAEDEQRIEAQTRAVAERVAQAESLAVAKSVAEDEVRARVQGGRLPGPVLEFLVEHWLRLLLLIHAKLGHASTQWKEALHLMDELAWSVEPKGSVEERRKVAAAVPRLLKGLTAGLQALGVDDQVRAAFFGHLMQYHTAVLGTGGKAKEDEAPGAQASVPGAGARALDFTAPVTVRNPYGGGQVQVRGLDSTVQGGARTGVPVSPPEDLKMGVWMEFRPKEGDGERRAAKLLFVTPKKTRYLFSDRNGRNILELTRAEIVRRMRTGEAVRLEGEPEEPLFDRIMNAVVEKLRSPAGRRP